MNYLEYSVQEQLISTFNTLSVPFVRGGSTDCELLSPTQLISGLSKQDDARMRLALIPLLLSRPDLADAVAEAVQQLPDLAAGQLRLYYTAATCLQEIYRPQLEGILGECPQLPDMFSKELGVASIMSPDLALIKLGRLHTELVGIKANWVGTYHHGAKRLLKRLECEVAWGRR